MRRMILSENVFDEKIFLFFALLGNSIPHLVRLSGHWRWVFWLMLVAFAGSALQIPVTLLQIAGVLPSPILLWYSLFRMGVAVVEITIAVWMIHIYRHKGVWALGKKRHER